MTDRERYGFLAKSLMIAFMANRLGTKIATEERRMRDFPIADVGQLWIELAKLAEAMHLASVDGAMKSLSPREPSESVQ